MRVLTRNGIELNNLTYRSEKVSDLLGALWPRARKRNTSAHGVKVKVKYHPDDLGQIYVWIDGGVEYHEMPCTKPAYAKGLSEHYHSKLREWAKETNRAFSSQADMCRARQELYDLMDTIAAGRVRERKRLQRLRHPERQLLADRVRMTSVDGGNGDELDEVGSVEVLINPLRNRADGSELHPRRLLKGKPKQRSKLRNQPAERAPTIVVDLRESETKPMANFDFGAELAAARAESENGQ